ncbi:putative hexose transport-related protein [Naematelia encephala]|uniref:Putative hexose transport-related protein n=1 Tax=Naematelia encephala TaxID=71784 RepID=A0A1Y2AZ20_9TREE|nr:putative hexose transport-related protein [Naematelia encephala]
MFGNRLEQQQPNQTASHSFFSGANKNDPKQIYNWKIYVLTATACMGGFLYGYDSGVMGGILALKSFKTSFNLLDLNATELANQSANIVAMLQAGAFFGSLLVGPISDRWGRKPCLMAGAVIFIIGSIMQVVSAPHVGLLMGGRVIGGLGVGVCSTLAPLYTSENVPKAIRGRLTACYQLFIQVGLLISFWINYGMSVNYPSVALQWKTSIAIQIVPGALLLFGMIPLRESPRHLLRSGRPEPALEVLSWLRSLPPTHPYVESEYVEMQTQMESDELVGRSTPWQLYKEAFLVRSNQKRLALGLGVMVLQQLMGVNAINYYSPQIFQNLGLTGVTVSLFATGIYGVVKVVSSLAFALFLADTLGRRISLIWTATGQAFCLYYVGAFVKIVNPTQETKVQAAGYVALVCIFLYIVFFEFGWGPVPWIYNAEIHSSRLRGTCLGLAAAVNWLFNFVVSRATPVMLTTMGRGGYGTFLLYGSFCVVCIIFAVLFCPETKGMSLEEMDDFFGTTSPVDVELGARGAVHDEDAEAEKDGEERIENSGDSSHKKP